MELADLLPLEAPGLRSRLEELIGTLDSAAYDTPQPDYKRLLGRTSSALGWIYDSTTTDVALEHLLARYRQACEQTCEVARLEGSPVALIYEWLIPSLMLLLQRRLLHAGLLEERAEAVFSLLFSPQQPDAN